VARLFEGMLFEGMFKWHECSKPARLGCQVFSGKMREACSCSSHAHVGMLKWIAPAPRELHFGTLFDQLLADAQLPDTLRALIFGASFSQCIDNVRLPPRLEVGTTLLWQQLHRRGLSLAVLSLARQLATSCRRLVLIWGIVAICPCKKSVCLRNCSNWKWDIRLISRSATSAGRGVCKPWPLV